MWTPEREQAAESSVKPCCAVPVIRITTALVEGKYHREGNRRGSSSDGELEETSGNGIGATAGGVP